jgi:hypothetical protein
MSRAANVYPLIPGLIDCIRREQSILAAHFSILRIRIQNCAAATENMAKEL